MSQGVKLRISKGPPSPIEQISSLYSDLDEQIFETIEVPSTCVHFGISDQYGAAFGFIPLALAVGMVCFLFVIWGLYDIMSPIIGDDRHFSWDDTGDVVTGVFKVIFGSMGLFASIFTLTMGIHVFTIAYGVFIVSQAVTFLTKWMEWILAMTGITMENQEKWVPDSLARRYMIFYSVGFFLLMTFSLAFFLGWCKSIKMIMSIGGSGWHRSNYIQILTRSAPPNKVSLQSCCRPPSCQQSQQWSYSGRLHYDSTTSLNQESSHSLNRESNSNTATTTRTNSEESIIFCLRN